MIASRIARADTRFGPTRFGGSSSAMIGSTIAHSSSGTRQIGGNGSRRFFPLAILHLLLTRRCSPHASLEIVTHGGLVSCVRIGPLPARVGRRRVRPVSAERWPLLLDVRDRRPAPR